MNRRLVTIIQTAAVTGGHIFLAREGVPTIVETLMGRGEGEGLEGGEVFSHKQGAEEDLAAEGGKDHCGAPSELNPQVPYLTNRHL